MNFTIPGNSSQYVSLHDSYMFVQCHVEETYQYGNTMEDKSTQCVGRSLQEEVEEDVEQGMVANGSRNTRAVSTQGSKKNDQQPTADEVEDLLEDAEKNGHQLKKHGLNMEQRLMQIKRKRKEYPLEI